MTVLFQSTTSDLTSETCSTSISDETQIKNHINQIPSGNFILYEITHDTGNITPISSNSKTISSKTESISCDNVTFTSCLSVEEPTSENSTQNSQSGDSTSNYNTSSSSCKTPTILNYVRYEHVTIIVRKFRSYVELETQKVEDVITYEMWNESNMKVIILTYGARIHEIHVPDRHGSIENILLCCNNIQEYRKDKDMFLNATMGRTIGIVRDAQFCINGEYTFLSQNKNEIHHLNGGFHGLDCVNWGHSIDKGDVLMTYISPENTEGYPGSLLIQARFELSNTNEFKITYTAKSTSPTPCNISNRLYFNLAGGAQRSYDDCTLYDHYICVNGNKYTYNRKDGTPYKLLKNVANTEFDLRVPQTLGVAIARHPDEGFDNLYQICGNSDLNNTVKFVSRIVHPDSGRALEYYTNQNFVWFNTCNDFSQNDVQDIHPDYDLQYLGFKKFLKKDPELRRKKLSQKTTSLTKFKDTTNKFLSKLNAELKVPEKLEPKHSELTIHNSQQSLRDIGACEDKEILNDNKNEIEETKFLKHCGWYFQPQNFPNAVNHQDKYSDIILRPGHTYENVILLKFGVHTGVVNCKESGPKAEEPVLENPCCEPNCPRSHLKRCCSYCEKNCKKCI